MPLYENVQQACMCWGIHTVPVNLLLPIFPHCELRATGALFLFATSGNALIQQFPPSSMNLKWKWPWCSLLHTITCVCVCVCQRDKETGGGVRDRSRDTDSCGNPTANSCFCNSTFEMIHQCKWRSESRTWWVGSEDGMFYWLLDITKVVKIGYLICTAPFIYPVWFAISVFSSGGNL